MFYYFLGGLPPDITHEDVKNFISNDLHIESLEEVWLDPFCKSRAVMQCFKRHDTKFIQNRMNEGKEIKERIFVTEENTTNAISVVVPNSKCEALIDKLPWVFHQRKKQGSKVSDVKQMPKDNSYILTFSDGWDGVKKVLDQTWCIGNSKLRVTPFFACFDGNYEQQRCYHLGEKSRERRICSKTHVIPSKTQPDMSSKTQPDISSKTQPDISSKTQPDISSKTQPDISSKAQPDISSKTHVIPPKTRPVIPPKPMQNHQRAITPKGKPAVPPKQNVKSESYYRPEPITPKGKPAVPPKQNVKSESYYRPEPITPKGKPAVPPKQNVKSESYYRPEPITPKGKPAVPPKQNVKSESYYRPEPESYVLYSTISSVSAIRPKNESPVWKGPMFIFVDRILLALLNCLSMKTKLEDAYPCLELSTDVKQGKMSLIGPEGLVEKLRGMVVNLYQIIEDMNELELFLSCEKDQQALIEHFQTHQVFLTVEENDDQLEVFVKLDRRKISFKEFCSTMIICSDKIAQTTKSSQMLDDVVNFNNGSTLFKLKNSRENMLHLYHINIGIDKRDRTSVIDNVESLFKGKLIPEQCYMLYISKPLVYLFIAFELEKKIQQKFPKIKLSMDDDTGFISMSGWAAEKLNNLLVSLERILNAETYFFHEKVKDCLISDHFNAIILEENGDVIDLYVQEKDAPKISFHDFVAQVIRREGGLTFPNVVSSNRDVDNKGMPSYEEAFMIEYPAYEKDWIPFYLTEEQKRFLNEHNNVISMAKHLKLTEADFDLKANVLNYRASDSGPCFSNLKNYLVNIKYELISVPFPGVPQFYDSIIGRKLFSEIQQKQKCVIMLRHQDDSKSEDVSSAFERATVLRTTICNKLINFHVIQDNCNVEVDVSIHICPSDSGDVKGSYENPKKAFVYLPEWSESTKDQQSQEEDFKTTFETLLYSIEDNISALSFSVSNKFPKSFPSSIIIQCIVKKVCDVFTTSRDDIHIYFLCESKSHSLLKALDSELTALIGEGSQSQARCTTPNNSCFNELSFKGDKFDDASYQLTVVYYKNLNKSHVISALEKKLQQLMNINECKITLTLQEKEAAKKIMGRENKIYWEFKRNGKKGEPIELCLRGLVKEFVDNAAKAVSENKADSKSKSSVQVVDNSNEECPLARNVKRDERQHTQQIVFDEDETDLKKIEWETEGKLLEQNRERGEERQEEEKNIIANNASHTLRDEDETKLKTAWAIEAKSIKYDLESARSDEEFQWLFYKKNNFEPFDDKDSEKLEKAYQEGLESCKLVDLEVDFSSMVAKWSKNSLECQVIRHEILLDWMVSKPMDWRGDTLKIITKKADKDFTEIDNLLQHSLSSFIVHEMSRIQNLSLFSRYNLKMKKIKLSNERVMWQRIPKHSKDVIVEMGCQKCFLGVKCEELGDGICFASNVKHCVTNEDVKDGNKILLLRCLVCAGYEGEGCPGLRFPPIDKTSGQTFTSVSNDQFCMIFNSSLVFPTHFVQLQFRQK